MSKAIVLASCLFGACSVGEVGTNMQAPPLDGPVGVTIDAPTTLNCATRVSPPTAAHPHIQSGTSNQGQSCLDANCHSSVTTGTGAPAFQYAGTVMSLATPGTGNAGITVTIKSATTVTATTDTDGNFYYPPPIGTGTGTLIPNPFPAAVNVDVCPSTAPTIMSDSIVQGQGGCNAGGTCHGVGGTAGPVSL
jgi:hypothetical protein